MKAIFEWIGFGILAIGLGIVLSLFGVYALNKITGEQLHHKYGRVER